MDFSPEVAVRGSSGTGCGDAADDRRTSRSFLQARLAFRGGSPAGADIRSLGIGRARPTGEARFWRNVRLCKALFHFAAPWRSFKVSRNFLKPEILALQY